MGTDGGLVTARIESPGLMRNSAVKNIESVIDPIRVNRINIDRCRRNKDGHLIILTLLLVSIRGAFTPACEYEGWEHNTDTG
jgi:hypothetical protein